jgi:phospholipid/cholesterol/gamma-HCH transport system substrate-binding protein
MDDRTRRIRLGIFALVVLGLLGTLIVLFGSLPTFFQRTNTYTVRFTDAPGISPGTPVRRSGVRIGEVSGVELDEERGIVRVQLAIGVRYTLRRNDRPMIVLGLLGSDAAIDIVPQQPEAGEEPDRTPLRAGAELVGFRAASVNTLLTRATEVVPTTQETLADIRKSMQRLERMAPLAEETMREYRDLARAAQREIPNVSRTNEELRQLIADTRQAVPEVRATNKEYQELAREVRQAIPELKQTNQEVQRLAKEVREAIPDLRNTSADIGTAARNWGRVGERVNVLLQSNEEKLVKALDQINDTLERVANVFNEENQRNVNAILRNLSTASDHFPAISRNTEDILNQSRLTIRRLDDALTQVDQILTDLRPTTQAMSEHGRSIVENLDQTLKPLAQRSERILQNVDEGIQELRQSLAPFTQRGDQLARNLDQALERANEVMGDLRALMRAIDQSDGTFRRILTDPTIYNRVDETIFMVQRLIPRLDRILKDTEVFADKIARHPESIGVRGAIRPDSGLKTPPRQPIHYQP